MLGAVIADVLGIVNIAIDIADIADIINIADIAVEIGKRV